MLAVNDLLRPGPCAVNKTERGFFRDRAGNDISLFRARNRHLWVKVLGKHLEVDPDVLGKSDDVSVTEELFPKKQYSSMAAIKASLDEISEDEPKARSLEPENFVDTTFIAELDKNGYIDSLYRSN